MMIITDTKNCYCRSRFVNIRPVNTPWAVTTNFAFTEDGRYAVYGTLREDNYVKELYLYDVQADSSKRLWLITVGGKIFSGLPIISPSS